MTPKEFTKLSAGDLRSPLVQHDIFKELRKLEKIRELMPVNVSTLHDGISFTNLVHCIQNILDNSDDAAVAPALDIISSGSVQMT